MFLAYVAAAIIGLILLGASLVLGGHGHDAGHPGGDHEASTMTSLPVTSLRFWTYLLAFGGTTGVLLVRLAHVHEPIAALVSVGVGTLTGWLAHTMLSRAMAKGDSGTTTNEAIVGRTGDVIVPLGHGVKGKVRVRVAGSDVDLVAHTDDEKGLDHGDEVVVVDIRDGDAIVTRAPSSR